MNVQISRRARREAERLDAWWRENRDSPDLFAREFQAAVEMLATAPLPGTPFPTTRHPDLRRLLMTKSRAHIYFEIVEALDVVRILAIWGAPRGRTPAI